MVDGAALDSLLGHVLERVCGAWVGSRWLQLHRTVMSARRETTAVIIKWYLIDKSGDELM
uniref:Uncharacterized protein n=1 Tax=Oryza brachyantha TaxID=4533 RepID=J3MSF6_ORYBR